MEKTGDTGGPWARRASRRESPPAQHCGWKMLRAELSGVRKRLVEGQTSAVSITPEKPAYHYQTTRTCHANVSTQATGQLPGDVKSTGERLLGRSFARDEEISIVAGPPQRVPSAEDRFQVARKPEALFNRRAEAGKGP